MVNEGEDHSCVKIGKEKSLINIIKKPKVTERKQSFIVVP